MGDAAALAARRGRRASSARPLRVRLDLRLRVARRSRERLLDRTEVGPHRAARRRHLPRAATSPRAIPATLGRDVPQPRTGRELNRSLFSALWLEKMAISITIGLIVMVAALNIVASLILLVMEKSRDIAILKTMGASARSIMADLHAAGADHRRRRHGGRRGGRATACRTCSTATS